MLINYNRSGMLWILKIREKVGVILNSQNILEVETYKYLGIMINHSLKEETQSS